jgi:two-component system NtrC family response regulator
MRLLTGHDWRGNVRELAHVLERAEILAEGDTITADDLPETLRSAAAREPYAPASPFDLDNAERRQVVEALRQMKGNKVHAARALGVSRRSLYRLIDKHGLTEFAAERPALSTPPETVAVNPAEESAP